MERKTARTILKEHIEKHYSEMKTSEVYVLAMQAYADQENTVARIEENQSILEMAKIHMDERAVIVITSRIEELKKEK